MLSTPRFAQIGVPAIQGCRSKQTEGRTGITSMTHTKQPRRSLDIVRREEERRWRDVVQPWRARKRRAWRSRAARTARIVNVSACIRCHIYSQYFATETRGMDRWAPTGIKLTDRDTDSRSDDTSISGNTVTLAVLGNVSNKCACALDRGAGVSPERCSPGAW